MMIRWVISLCLLFQQVHLEIFTSLEQFQRILHLEAELAENLQAAIEAEERRLVELKSIQLELADHSATALGDPEAFLANPINAFLLIKRATKDWQQLIGLLRDSPQLSLAEQFASRLGSACSDSDLQGSARALLRLQDTYALHTDTMALGIIPGVPRSQQLDASSSFHVGRIAYESRDFYHAILWFEQALASMTSDLVMGLTRANLLDYLAFSHYSRGHLHVAANLTRQWLDLEPHNARALVNLAGYEEEISHEGTTHSDHDVTNERMLQGYRAGKKFEIYERLCRNEAVQPNPYRHRLVCSYVKPHPYYILRPLKEEVMYEDPRIVIYHDLIVDSEMETIKDLARPMLHTSGVFDAKDDCYSERMNDARVSMSAWIEDGDHKLVKRISDKVEAATGLAVASSEDFQVLNYGLGGQYEPHMDYAQEGDNVMVFPHFRDFGNRISTTLCYISKVAAGGATVFPYIGLHVAPEKGSVVHWFNLKRSGAVDPRTLHAGCPVLSGTKWVCNKWVHERGQEFRRPCTLNDQD